MADGDELSAESFRRQKFVSVRRPRQYARFCDCTFTNREGLAGKGWSSVRAPVSRLTIMS